MISYQKTPVDEMSSPLLKEAGVKLLIKREYLNHVEIQGNKWWKLKYNLAEAKKLEKNTLLTLGGAYSNHIYATASAARELGFKSIGIIRGEAVLPLNRTLQFAVGCGMKLHFVSRDRYRQRAEAEFVKELHALFGDFYFIPEGGSNALAVKGCAEFADNLLNEIDFDVVCLPVGTGGTMAGMVAGFGGQKEIVGVAVLKGGEFLMSDVNTMVQNYCGREFTNNKILFDYHFGGYAKSNDELLEFMADIKTNWNIPMEPVYSGKALFGLMDQVRKGAFQKGSTLLFIHTGGMQSQP